MSNKPQEQTKQDIGVALEATTATIARFDHEGVSGIVSLFSKNEEGFQLGIGFEGGISINMIEQACLGIIGHLARSQNKSIPNVILELTVASITKEGGPSTEELIPKEEFSQAEKKPETTGDSDGR